MAEVGAPLTRAAFIDRLRAWIVRADNEIAHAHGANTITWQGHTNVLRAALGAASGGTGGIDDVVVFRNQLIADRQKAIVSWEGSTNPSEIAYNAGQVQGYHLILDLLKDAGDTWG